MLCCLREEEEKTRGVHKNLFAAQTSRRGIDCCFFGATRDLAVKKALRLGRPWHDILCIPLYVLVYVCIEEYRWCL